MSDATPLQTTAPLRLLPTPEQAARVGIAVEWVDPAHTSRTCPACGARNSAVDRRYVCIDCGWMGHRDAVGAINISRRAGRRGDSAGATGA